MGKKLISISMVRNENDVIESFVRHNLELMDEMHIIDHGSSDGTREILIQLKEEGLPVFIYQYQALKFNHEQLVNLLMKQLVAKDEAIDFVFPLDADEFISCSSRAMLEQLLDVIGENRIGMYLWRGYLPTSLQYNPDFTTQFTEQRLETLFTPKVIVPRWAAESCSMIIGSHYMLDKDGNKVKSTLFHSPDYRGLHSWFIEQFSAQFAETDLLWLGHFPIRSLNQHIKKILEKSILIAIKDGSTDIAWENQLRELLDNGMKMDLNDLRLLAYKYRAGSASLEASQCEVSHYEPLRKKPLTLKYTSPEAGDPLMVVGHLVLALASGAKDSSLGLKAV